MFSFSDQSFPSHLDLLLGKYYLVRTVMIHYQIDDITANTQSRFSSHLKWHNSINLNGIMPAYNKCKTDDENTNTYYNTAVLLKQVQEIRHSLTFEEELTRGILQGLLCSMLIFKSEAVHLVYQLLSRRKAECSD